MRPSLRPPSSKHCEEVLSFPDKAANLRLCHFGKEHGASPAIISDARVLNFILLVLDNGLSLE